MIAFLEAVLMHYVGRPIVLILDHASIHKSKALMAWLAQHLRVTEILPGPAKLDFEAK